MVLEQRKSIFNNDYDGVPDFYTNGDLPYNTLWGTEYIVLYSGVPSEKEFDYLIEGFLMLRQAKRYML